MPDPDEASRLHHSRFGHAPAHVAFAPGRIEFIGNHTDYNGGLVLGAAVEEGVTAAGARREDGKIAMVSGEDAAVEVPVEGLAPREGDDAWANYPLGVAAMMREDGVDLAGGFSLAVTSDLPSGAGLSSSAALELATAHVLAALFGHEAGTAVMARLCRRAENEFVGMPCGILDQGVSAFGRAGHLVRIDCATETFATLPLPAGARFWIFNSNRKHTLVDSAYADRHRECMEAVKCLREADPSVRTLSDVDERALRANRELLGEPFFRRALHVVTENARVRSVESALAADDLEAVGAAINASHESSRVNFENSTAELDALVGWLNQQPGVHGARLTGGGFGGAVLALTGEAFGEREADRVRRAYAGTFGIEASVLASAPGAGARLLV